MNCKQGDLAIVTKSYAGNEGKIVKCIKFIGEYEYSNGDSFISWKVEPKLISISGSMNDFIGDHQLRPIRDRDDEDEMLKITGKPEIYAHINRRSS